MAVAVVTQQIDIHSSPLTLPSVRKCVESGVVLHRHSLVLPLPRHTSCLVPFLVSVRRPRPPAGPLNDNRQVRSSACPAAISNNSNSGLATPTFVIPQLIPQTYTTTCVYNCDLLSKHNRTHIDSRSVDRRDPDQDLKGLQREISNDDPALDHSLTRLCDHTISPIGITFTDTKTTHITNNYQRWVRLFRSLSLTRCV